MELNVLQKMLDEDKWYESERAHRDVCGEFPYCVRCDRKQSFPCALAYTKFYAKEDRADFNKNIDTAFKERRERL